MSTVKFKYRLDRRARITTWSVLGAIALVVGLLWGFAPGGYLPAWFLSIAAAFILLAALSIPRSLRVTDRAVEIRCLVEITHIPFNHIRSVRPARRDELRKMLPVFSSLGFFGYFGYLLDIRGWDIIKAYTTSREGLVVIEDIFEQRYLVNTDRPDEFISAVNSHLAR